jgi:hypothetical protein
MKHVVNIDCVRKRATPAAENITLFCMSDQNFSNLLKMLVFASCFEVPSQGSKYRTKYSGQKNMFLFLVFFWRKKHQN